MADQDDLDHAELTSDYRFEDYYREAVLDHEAKQAIKLWHQMVLDMGRLLIGVPVRVNMPHDPSHGQEGYIADFWSDGCLLVRFGFADSIAGYYAEQLEIRAGETLPDISCND